MECTGLINIVYVDEHSQIDENTIFSSHKRPDVNKSLLHRQWCVSFLDSNCYILKCMYLIFSFPVNSGKLNITCFLENAE